MSSAAAAQLPSWRRRFKTRSQLEQGPIQFFIKDFLPEGVTFLGGLSGHGKSWLALSMAKALTTGQRFLKMFEVAEPQNVIYMAPESGEKSFRTRLDLMGIPEERFLCTTVSNGIIKLSDMDLMVAVQKLRPIVFLDTAIRFMQGADENSSSETSTSLANACFKLRVAGAQAIAGLHHSPKASANNENMTLENTLRGTGDIGAMCDAVWGIRCIDKEQVILRIVPVKARDFEPPPPFHIQGRPYISETGDFGVLTGPPVSSRSRKLSEAIKRNPRASYRELSIESGIGISHIAAAAAREGWQRVGRSFVPGNVPSISKGTNPSVPTTPLKGVEQGTRTGNMYDSLEL